MNRTTNFTGALSSASNSIPVVDLPKAATTSSSRSDEQCGMAIPKPMPVLIVSSRCLNAARIESRSADLTLPRLTSRSISSTIADQRSVAFISGTICSAESRLARDMRMLLRCGRPSLTARLGLTRAFSESAGILPTTSLRESYNPNAARAASVHQTCRWWRGQHGCPSRIWFGQNDVDDGSLEFQPADTLLLSA